LRAVTEQLQIGYICYRKIFNDCTVDHSLSKGNANYNKWESCSKATEWVFYVNKSAAAAAILGVVTWLGKWYTFSTIRSLQRSAQRSETERQHSDRDT
jgi:hypothetical protein